MKENLAKIAEVRRSGAYIPSDFAPANVEMDRFANLQHGWTFLSTGHEFRAWEEFVSGGQQLDDTESTQWPSRSDDDSISSSEDPNEMLLRDLAL